jgi:predicted GNAT family acetyltransferase
MGFLEPWLQEGPVVDELVVIRKNLRFDRLVPFTFEADSVPLVVSTGGFFGSLLGTASIEWWVDIDKVYAFSRNRLQNSKVIPEVDSVSYLGHKGKINTMGPKVIHNQEAHRYELWLEDKRIGLADYSLMPGERHFVHTEVDLDQQNKGYAADLMREALADVRANSKDKVVPVCSYVVMYMKRHPETHDLLKGSIEEAVAACRWPGARA